MVLNNIFGGCNLIMSTTLIHIKFSTVIFQKQLYL